MLCLKQFATHQDPRARPPRTHDLEEGVLQNRSSTFASARFWKSWPQLLNLSSILKGSKPTLHWDREGANKQAFGGLGHANALTRLRAESMRIQRINEESWKLGTSTAKRNFAKIQNISLTQWQPQKKETPRTTPHPPLISPYIFLGKNCNKPPPTLPKDSIAQQRKLLQRHYENQPTNHFGSANLCLMLPLCIDRNTFECPI